MVMDVFAFMDSWRTPEEQIILDGWAEAISGLQSRPAHPHDRPSAEDVARVINTVRARGWLEFGLGLETGEQIVFEAIKVLHQRLEPVSAPLPEIWMAAQLMRAAGVADVESYLNSATPPVLGMDDLISPPEAGAVVRTGWIPNPGGLSIVIPLRTKDGSIEVWLSPEQDEAEEVSCPDPSQRVRRFYLNLRDGNATAVGRLDPKAFARMQSKGLLAQASAMVGQARALLTTTRDYLCLREQFGVPVGSFQALKHRCADMATSLHAANLVTAHAAAAVVGTDPADHIGDLAKSFAGSVAVRIASEAVQLHGGMGYTWENPIHFGLKRTMYLAATGRSVRDCEVRLGKWSREGDVSWGIL